MALATFSGSVRALKKTDCRSGLTAVAGEATIRQGFRGTTRSAVPPTGS